MMRDLSKNEFVCDCSCHASSAIERKVLGVNLVRELRFDQK